MTDNQRPFLPDGYHPLAPGKLANLVTFLEMTAPPPRRRRAPEGYAIEPVDVWNTDDFVALYTEIGFEWLWSSRLLMPKAELEAKLSRPTLRSWCPAKDGRRVGLIEMDFAREHEGEVEISFFGLVPQTIGGGLGGWAMEEAIAIAFGRPGVTRLWLHTCHFDSPQALPFYMHMGFSPYARAVEVHDDGRLSGRIDAASGPHIPIIRNARRPDGV